MQIEVLRTRRLSPIELLLETWRLYRREWRAVLVVGLAVILPALALNTGLRGLLVRHVVEHSPFLRALLFTSWSYALIFGSASIGMFIQGIGTMALALVVIGALHGAPETAAAALRRTIRVAGSWTVLSILETAAYMTVLGRIMQGLLWSQSALHDQLVGPMWGQHNGWWWSAIYSSPRWISNAVVGATFAYLAFAPIHLALAGGGIVCSVTVSFKLVRRNWLWVCIGAIVLTLPGQGIAALLHLVPKHPLLSYLTLAVWSLVLPFSRIGLAVQYVNLTERAESRELARGPERGEPSADLPRHPLPSRAP